VEAGTVLEASYNLGFRRFDTAGFYARGNSETLLERVFGSNRAEIFISSKGGLSWDGNDVVHDATPDALKTTLYRSLDRLKTDYLDLYSLHWPDKNVPIQDSISALMALKDEGLIKEWGVSNLTSEEVDSCISPQSSIYHQVHFNPIHDKSEPLIFGKQENRCRNIVYSPLEQGLLANPNRDLGKKDVRNRNPYFKTRPNVNMTVHEVYDWILDKDFVDGIIFGPRNLAQIKDIGDFMAKKDYD